MTPEEFVRGFYLEKKILHDLYFDHGKKTEVSELIARMNLNVEQKKLLSNVLDSVLTDAFYTVLLGLDGEAQIGATQETYKIEDQEGNELTGGEIEAYAWEYFHNHKYEKGEQ